MLVRIVQFLLGAVLAGGGGYLAWTHRSGGMDIFPPAAGMPWLVIAGVLLLSAGIVFLVSAVHPRPQRKARLAALAADRDATLGAAEDYYSERGRAADRDWRAGDIPAPVAPVVAAPVVAAPVVEPVRVATPPAPPPPVPPPVIAPAPAKPVATSAPPPAAVPEVFPATVTLAPLPAAAEPPPAPVATPVVAPVPVAAEPVAIAPAVAAPLVAPVAEPVAVAASAPVAPADPMEAIRVALAAGQLDDVDKLLNARRETAKGLELAELTGLAGDHAAALGRASNAKWLWRLSLKRFGELNAMETPAARAVAESLRVSG